MSRTNTGEAGGATRVKSRDADMAAEVLNEKVEPLRKKKGRRAPIIVGALILLVLLGAGITFGTIWILNSIKYVSTDDAAIDGDHVNVSTKMLGRIASVMVAEGTEVEARQLLVLLDDVDLRAQEAQAASSLNYARENLVLARVNLDKTRDDFNRTNTLFKGGAATREQYDHASRALETANAQYSIAQAQIDTANAQLRVIEAQLLNTRITAPISGTIAKKPLMPGELVQPGQTILSINDLQHLWVTANFEETKIGQIHAGDRVMISVDAYPDHELTGTLLWIGAAAASQFSLIPPNNASGNFTKVTQRVPVRISIDRPELGTQDPLVLVPGLSVEVSIKVREQ
jgi:membrane fusion protein (multidrug efflux system)